MDSIFQWAEIALYTFVAAFFASRFEKEKNGMLFLSFALIAGIAWTIITLHPVCHDASCTVPIQLSE